MDRLTDTPPLAARPPAPASQAAVFRRLRSRLWRNGFRELYDTGRVRLVTMLGTSAVVAGFVFGLSLYAFLELFRLNIPFKGLIVGGLFDLLFFTLGVMLLFSTGIILYASLFTAPEAKFLLTTPATADRIFAAKFQAAVGFSSWGFVILGLPILVAYGLVAGVPWYFYPLLPLYLFGFVLLPGAVSALVCLLVVRYPLIVRLAAAAVVAVFCGIVSMYALTLANYYYPKQTGTNDRLFSLDQLTDLRPWVMAGTAATAFAGLTAVMVVSVRAFWQLVGVLAAGYVVVWLAFVWVVARQTLASGGGRDALEGFVGQFALAQHPLAPSHWMTNGLLAAAREDVPSTALPLAMIWSNGLLAFVVAAFAAGRIYRTGFDRIAGGFGSKKKFRASTLDRVMEMLVFYLDKPTRILVVKDFRTFRRDPTQWVLVIIFAVLMGIAAMNFRQYYATDLDVLDKYIIGLVNVGGVAVLLCAGLSRFIFPLISLEGRKFWILGLLPVKREQILRGKFAFAATGSVLIAEVLVVGGEILLNLPAGVLVLHGLTAAVVAFGLSGLNVGLGAYMPNFRETDPSKIVAGFSGTVNMVVGLLFVVVTVGVMTLPMHLAAVMRHFHRLPPGEVPWWVYAGLPVGLAVGVAATLLPMRAGVKALRETEF